MKILDLLDLCDNEFKEKFIKNAFDFVKEEKIYKIKYNFIIENAHLIAKIRNTELVFNHGDIPSYCLYDEYSIIKEFEKNKEYPNEIDWLNNYKYSHIIIPYYNYDNDYDDYDDDYDNNYIDDYDDDYDNNYNIDDNVNNIELEYDSY